MSEIPSSVPDPIAERIYQSFGDMKALSRAVDLPYMSVYSVLVRSNHRPIKVLEALARPLGITADQLAEVLCLEDLSVRKQKLDALLNGKSLYQWERDAGLSNGTASYHLNNLNPTHIRNAVKIAHALELDLVGFRLLFS